MNAFEEHEFIRDRYLNAPDLVKNAINVIIGIFASNRDEFIENFLNLLESRKINFEHSKEHLKYTLDIWFLERDFNKVYDDYTFAMEKSKEETNKIYPSIYYYNPKGELALQLIGIDNIVWNFFQAIESLMEFIKANTIIYEEQSKKELNRLGLEESKVFFAAYIDSLIDKKSREEKEVVQFEKIKNYEGKKQSVETVEEIKRFNNTISKEKAEIYLEGLILVKDKEYNEYSEAQVFRILTKKETYTQEWSAKQLSSSFNKLKIERFGGDFEKFEQYLKDIINSG